MKKSALAVGVDVPWVTSWTEETVIGVRPCATVAGRPALVQTDAAGFGRPQYSQNHLVRQRQTVLRMLCPMCGQPTQAGDRWTQVARQTPAGLLRRAGKAVGLSRDIEDRRVVIDAGSIAPLHKACVDRSLRYCPHLKADPNVNVMPFPAQWTVLPLLIEAAPMLETGELAGAAVLVVTFLQLVGITGRTDRDWRFRKAPREPQPAS
ncbi:hypothetical protein GGQ87_002902 [Brevundimonas alba]|uniref:Uncharacterized protein n=1 Tax=Brevundimonas alba TaxID=74314 RepID=A0A7X6BPM7_9CAUL|nr:hypothetical protein [Brevundimonas alba]NJC42607.1 hypothetical protein [Brevundimonas alba]